MPGGNLCTHQCIWRFFEKEMPTAEKRRSTVAEVAGQPRLSWRVWSRIYPVQQRHESHIPFRSHRSCARGRADNPGPPPRVCRLSTRAARQVAPRTWSSLVGRERLGIWLEWSMYPRLRLLWTPPRAAALCAGGVAWSAERAPEPA